MRDVPQPQPAKGEVLVAVHATTVTRSDCGFLAPHPSLLRLFYGWSRPRQPILGMDFAGTVEAIGEGVSAFHPGDRVFGMLRWHELGAHAEYVCVPEDGYIAPMPADARFGEVVVCEGAFYAFNSLKALKLKAGDRILIYGASGAIGTAAVQLAQIMGARVTAVVATQHVELLKSLGAERVIDYTREDFTRIGETFDCMLDAVGKTTYSRSRRLMKPGAVFAGTDIGPWAQTLVLVMWFAITGSRRVIVAMPRPIAGFAQLMREHIQAGTFCAVIDRRYPLEQIREAYAYVETGQKTGIVVINVRPDEAA
ncbi:MAG TPA: NAD(P)-dependent alcohol dehydrogenase [Candidatus Eisenbacteria bacterium]|nr:NAD(P)-dependent alcohol dehydrogenase [Candidatus Eisenbacteria bacterium]